MHAFSWGSRFQGRPGLAFTMPVCDDELRKAMSDDGLASVRLVPLPPLLGAFLWAGESAQLVKAASHKYIRKVPDGKGGWRYFYAVTGGKGLGHEDEIQTGAAFKLAHNGQAGHFHVTGRDADGKITVKHDESGHTESLDPAVFVAMLHREHAHALDEHTKKLAASLKAAREHGTAKHVARLEAEAGRYGHTRHLAEASRYAPDDSTPDDAKTNQSIEFSRKLTELYRRRPRPVGKLFGKNGPTPEQKAKYDAEVKAWNSEYRKTKAAHKKAVDASNAEIHARQASPAAQHLDTARAHLEDAKVKAASGDKAGAQAEMKAAQAHAAAVRAHKEGGDTEKAAKAAAAATEAAGGPPEHKRAVPDQVTGDEQRQREEAARKSADRRRGTGKPDQGSPVAAGDVHVGERVVDGKGRTWERTSTAWRGVKPDGSPTGDVQTDKGMGRETLRRAMHNDGDKAVAVDAMHRAAGEAHARGDIEERNRLQDEAANLMPSTASGQPIPPADATPEERTTHTQDFGARDHADAAAHHAQEARTAEQAGNEQAADQHQAAADEHRQAAVEAIQQGQIHGPSTLTLESGKALPPHDAPQAAWDKATAGFNAADHDEAAALHRAKAFQADDDAYDRHMAASARHSQAADNLTAEPGARDGEGRGRHVKLEPHEREMLRDFVENTVKHRLDDLKQGLKEEQRFGGMSIYRTRNGKTFAAPTGANAHEIVQAWMKEMLHEAMPTVPDDIADKHGIAEEDRAQGVSAGMERVLSRALRQEATGAVVGKVQRLNNEALAALPPAKGSSAWKAMSERATQQQAGVDTARAARGQRAEQHLAGMKDKTEAAYAHAVALAILHGGKITLPRGKAGQAAADLPKDVKNRLRTEMATVMGHTGEAGAGPVDIAEVRSDAPQPKSLYDAARAGLAPPVETTVGARQQQAAVSEPVVTQAAPAKNEPRKDMERARAHMDEHRKHIEASKEATQAGDKGKADLHRKAAQAHYDAALGHKNGLTNAEGRSADAREATTAAQAMPPATENYDPVHVKAEAEKAKAHHDDMNEAHQAAATAARARGDLQAAARHRDAAEVHGMASLEHRNVAAGYANAMPARAAGASSRAADATEKAGDPKATTTAAAAQVTPPAQAEAPALASQAAGADAPSHRYVPPDGKFGTATIKADKHPTTGEDTHVVTLAHRLGDQHFPAASARARELGGNYVRRVGFSFPDRSAAEKFAAEHQHPGQVRPGESNESRAARGDAPRPASIRDHVSQTEREAHERAVAALNRFADVVDARGKPEEVAQARRGAKAAINAHEGSGSRQQWAGKYIVGQHNAALKGTLGEIEKVAHDRFAQARREADPKALAEHVATFKGYGNPVAATEFTRAVTHALDGSTTSAPRTLQLPSEQRHAVGAVTTEDAVRALHASASEGGRNLDGHARRAAHALGLDVPRSKQYIEDVPTAALSHTVDKHGTTSGVGREANEELKARQRVAHAMNVPISKVGPDFGTDKASITEGLDEVRRGLHSSDHKISQAAKAELDWRQSLADRMGHKLDLSTVTSGGKDDATWQAGQIANEAGQKYVRKGDRWHAVGKGGAIESYPRHRNDIEGGHTWHAETVSAADAHNRVANEVASSPTGRAELMEALQEHGGRSGPKAIETPGHGKLPFADIMRSVSMLEAKRGGRRDEPPATPWHEHMTDGQLKQAREMEDLHPGVRQNVEREIEARDHAGLGAKLETKPGEATPRNGLGESMATMKGESAHGLVVHKTPDGKAWNVTAPNGGALINKASTKGEAMQALAVFRKHAGRDLPSDMTTIPESERPAIVEAQKIAQRHIDDGIAARSVQVGAGKASSGDKSQHAAEIRRMAGESVPRAPVTKVEPKVLTPEQVRKRIGVFASKESTRPHLQGYYVDPKTNMGIATDGHRLAQIPVSGHDVQGEGKTEGAIYRHKDEHAKSREDFAAELRAKGSSEEDIARMKAHSIATLGAGSKVDAAFPDYTQILSRDELLTKDHLDAERVRKVLAHANPVASERTNGVMIHREGGKVYLGIGGSTSDHLPEHVKVPIGHTDHPDSSFALNGKYLDDALKGAKGSVELGVSSPLAPVSIRRTDGERHIVMPMRM